MRDRILETSLRLFSIYGIKSITMQDIARECGISKKTVYEHFADKSELVEAFTGFLTNAHCMRITKACAEGRDAIEELVLSLRQTEVLVKSINPILLFELEKYHPTAWKKITDFKHQFIAKNIQDNLERGIREGLYRSNIRTNIMVHMRLMQLDSAFNPLHFPATEFDIHEVMYEVTEHYIHGIATPEGHRKAEQYLAAHHRIT
ncbi:TetR/AcrR family transcriptional regulator [Chitinophaga sp. XS-30]|uniref:TetR/AcrR family transcriptional regulator n=1 Tax=Chitinophaga sp. XS-30 TaxID=2604421 RepID=UPI0011DCE1EF|nr:TetR/AcrR family transcriptional regulator [Chitinophaga sp. XS-30]QEH40055.1 TetR/AcrR family transcriptional regulator [Chitinophaga sp. XS-30]